MSEEGWCGPAAVVLGDREVEVDLDLRGHFEPLDGRFHWYGRVDAAGSERLAADAPSGTTVTVRTTYGEASGSLSDRDPWGRFRLAGWGRPPFGVGTAGPGDQPI